MEAWVSVNGVLSPASEARVSPLDRGFLFADSVFEVFVAFGSVILDQAPHLKRLRRSLEMIDLAIPYSDEDLMFELQAVNDQCKAPKKKLRLIITRGIGAGLKGEESGSAPTRVSMAFPCIKEDGLLYSRGLALKSFAQRSHQPGSHAKTSQYREAIVATRSLKDTLFDDILWLSPQQEFTESSIANVFFIGRSGEKVEIATPHSKSGLLEGITRGKIIELCENAGIAVTVRSIFYDELARFDEAFLCSTVRGLVPVHRIDEHKLHSARDSSIFRMIERLFMADVQVQLGFKPEWNS
jgi:branched-subunit amino acid aminotransferase/4-amino-4-deoxychorismate lyase